MSTTETTGQPAEEPSADVFVALLRGINVGRNRRIRMADLRSALEAAGFGRVRTVLQSGNVVLDAPGASAAEVSRRVHDAVLTASGFDVAVLVRTGHQLAGVVSRSPMPAPPDGSRFFVAFPDRPAATVERPPLPVGSEEQWWPEGQEIYVWCPGGLLESPLMSAFAGRHAVHATVRNWNTVTALARLLRG